MIGHSLKLIRFLDRNINGVDSPLETVFVTKDEWVYDKGRYIEFLAMNLPDFFVFAVREQDNKADLVNTDTGDSRFGSWVGIATKVGTNLYQGIQSSGLEREVSGMNVVGGNSELSFSDNGYTLRNDAPVLAASFGTNQDWALGYNFAKNVGFGPLETRLNKPNWGGSAQLPQYFKTVKFGAALDPTTRSLQKGASEIRKSMYDFDGTVVSTNFYPRTNEASITLTVGGVTYMPPKVSTWSGSLSHRTLYVAQPITTQNLSVTNRGNGRSVPAQTYALVYTQSASPYTTTFFRMGVTPEGNNEFVRSTGTPGVQGLHNLSQAITLYTTAPEDVLDTAANRNVLIEMAASMKTKQISYDISYPTTVPIPFNIITFNSSDKTTLAHSWVIQADFINHNYLIGG